MSTKPNKREAVRYRVLLPAQMTAPHAKGVMVRVVDISAVGCRFMTKASLNIQTSITLLFYQAEEHVDETTKEIQIKHRPCHNISCRVVRLFKSAENELNVYGVEFELRKNLGFISGLDPLSLNLNASLIESYQKFSASEKLLRTNGLREGETLEDGRALQGQSPYLINASLNLDLPSSSLQASMSYNVQGKTLEVVGDGFYPDVFTLPFHSLNLNVIKGVGKNKTLTLKVSNLLNQQRKTVYSKIIQRCSINRELCLHWTTTLVGNIHFWSYTQCIYT